MLSESKQKTTTYAVFSGVNANKGLLEKMLAIPADKHICLGGLAHQNAKVNSKITSETLVERIKGGVECLRLFRENKNRILIPGRALRNYSSCLTIPNRKNIISNNRWDNNRISTQFI